MRPNKKLSLTAPILFLALLSLVLAISVGLLLRQALNKADTVHIVTIEKLALTNQRDSLLVQLDLLETAYDSLLVKYQDFGLQVSFQRQELNRLRSAIQSGVTREVLAQCEKRMQELSVELSEYQDQLALLNAENQMLSGENMQIKTALQQMSERNIELEQQKQELADQVEMVSALKISQVAVRPTWERRRGVQETDRARRTDHVQVCFVIQENPLARAGDYNFYFRITDPDQRLLVADGVTETVYQGEQQNITDIKTVIYENAEIYQCFAFDSPSGFQKGIYHVEIFSEDKELWRGNFELR